MTEFCLFCNGPLNPFDEGVYKEVKGWVHGKKADSMTLREYTDKYAHERCILKQKAGQPADQPDLFGEDDVPENPYASMESDMMVDSIDQLLANPEPVMPGPSLEEAMGNNDATKGADPEENGYF